MYLCTLSQVHAFKSSYNRPQRYKVRNQLKGVLWHRPPNDISSRDIKNSLNAEYSLPILRYRLRPKFVLASRHLLR